MMCRSPTLTAAQIHQMVVMVRMRWVNLLHVTLAADLRVLPAEALADPVRHPAILRLLQGLVESTDAFAPLLEALIYWRFHLRANGVETVQTLMTAELHAQFLKLAQETLVAASAEMTPDAQRFLADFEAQRPALVKALEDAAYLNPSVSVSVPAGRPPPNVN